MGDELRKLLDKLRPMIPGDARDAALLAVGWAGALRRSELVGLSVNQLHVVAAERLTDRSVSRIVKARVRKHFKPTAALQPKPR